MTTPASDHHIAASPSHDLGAQPRVSGNTFDYSADLAAPGPDDALLIYVESGMFNIRSERNSLLISPRMAVYVPQQMAHQVRLLSPQVKGWMVHLPSLYCRPLASDLLTLQLSTLVHSLCGQILDLPLHTSPDQATGARWNNLVSVLALELENLQSSSTLEVPLPSSSQLVRIAEMIVRAPDDMQGLDHWSKEAGMSRRSFTRIFNQETGLSFAKWRNRVKLATAMQRLATGASVASISSELGYKNASAFNALFKRTFGVSPLAYVRQKNAVP